MVVGNCGYGGGGAMDVVAGVGGHRNSSGDWWRLTVECWLGGIS